MKIFLKLFYIIVVFFLLNIKNLYAIDVFTSNKKICINLTKNCIDINFKFYYDKNILLSYIISFQTQNIIEKNILYQIQAFYNSQIIGKNIDNISKNLKPLFLFNNESKIFLEVIKEFEENINFNKKNNLISNNKKNIEITEEKSSILPVFCTQEYAPVCGTNGKTYINKCYAQNQPIAYEGECNNIDKIVSEIIVNDDLVFALKQFFIELPTEYVDEIKKSFNLMHPTLRDRILFYFDKYKDVYKSVFFSKNMINAEKKIDIINIYTDIIERIYTLEKYIKELHEKINPDNISLIEDMAKKIKSYKFYENPTELIEKLDQLNIFVERNKNNIKSLNSKINTYIKDISDILKKVNFLKYEKGIIPFADIDENAWYLQYISKAKELNIIQGYQDETGKYIGIFGPNDEIKLSEALKIVLSTFNIEIDKKNMPQNILAQNHWAKEYYVTAEKLNLTIVQNPYENLNRSIQRDEFIRLILEVKKTPLQQDLSNPFIDLDISNENYIYVLNAYNKGIIKGDTGKNTVRPYDKINRAEAIKVILLAKEKL